MSLYTREYFALARERLSEGGLVSYWLPVDQLSGAETRAIIAAFCDVFGECSLWNGVGTAWMLVGSRGSRPAVSETDFARQWSATFMADAAFLKRLTHGQRPLVDDFPLRLSPTSTGRLDPTYAKLMDSDGALAARDFDAASLRFARALELDPRQVFLRGCQALAYCRGGQAERAIAPAPDAEMRSWRAGSCPSR